MKTFSIISNNVWVDEKFQPAAVNIKDNSITSIGEQEYETVVNYQDNFVVPGFIDIHTHGYGGGDASDGHKETIIEWCKNLPLEGVTTFLPGTVTRSEKRIIQALQSIASAIEEKPEGANIHGIFLQGPYTSHEYKGAYDPYLIQKPDIDQFERFYEAANGQIKMAGIAPEKDEGHKVIKHIVSKGIKMSMGFSGVSYEEAIQAMNDGVRDVTHCFNGMAPLHHRKPALAGAALCCDELFVEIIADGIHVHPAIINLVGRMKGKERLIVITDSSRYKGLKPGYYESVDRKVTIGEDGVGRLPDGTLAGSCITMIQSVKNLQELGELPLVTAINAATINPAKFLGIDDKKGLLKDGFDADITVFNKDYEILQTYVMGKAQMEVSK